MGGINHQHMGGLTSDGIEAVGCQLSLGIPQIHLFITFHHHIPQKNVILVEAWIHFYRKISSH
jgi:hypothetical protein